MSKKDYKPITVIFNVVKDPYQKRLYEHAIKYPNSSGYIKRLIQRDMEGGDINAKAK